MIQSDRLLESFLELLRIDSPSREEEEIGKHLAKCFTGMGLDVETDEIGNVIARMDGKGEALLLTAHMDNVKPCRGVVPVVEEGVVRSDGTTVLGSDDKAGVAIVLEVLHTIIEHELPHRPLEIVLTVQEEIGLYGAKRLDASALHSRLGIGLDAGGKPGMIIVSAPSHNRLTAVVRGKAAHAGICPEDGISALVIAAEAITQMELGRIDDETTANIGSIRGGTSANMIPDRVELRAEARSRSKGKLSSQTRTMVDALQETALKHGGAVEVQVERRYSGYTLTEDDEIVRLIMDGMHSLGVEPALIATGGGSDANVFNTAGIQVVNVGIGMARAHTTEEYIALSDMVSAAEIVLACVATG